MSRPATAAEREFVFNRAMKDSSANLTILRTWGCIKASLDAEPDTLRRSAELLREVCEAFDKAIESFVSALGSEVSWDDGAAHHAEDFCAALETEAERIEETRTEDDLASRFERGRVR